MQLDLTPEQAAFYDSDMIVHHISMYIENTPIGLVRPLPVHPLCDMFKAVCGSRKEYRGKISAEGRVERVRKSVQVSPQAWATIMDQLGGRAWIRAYIQSLIDARKLGDLG